MVFRFSIRDYIFSLGEKWMKIIFINKRMKIWYFLHTRVYVTNMTLFSWKKKERCHCPEKVHLRLTSLASPKKMIFILENMVFLLKYHIDWHPRKDPKSSHRRCSTKKGAPRNFAKFTGKKLCQSLFFSKATGLRPAILFKKSPGAGVFRWILRNFAEHLFYRTPLGGYSLFFYGDLYRRFYILLSSERKAGNLIYRIEIWLLLQFLWLEISSQELYLEVCLSVN